jgi:hypothetical protein
MSATRVVAIKSLTLGKRCQSSKWRWNEPAPRHIIHFIFDSLLVVEQNRGGTGGNPISILAPNLGENIRVGHVVFPTLNCSFDRRMRLS